MEKYKKENPLRLRGLEITDPRTGSFLHPHIQCRHRLLAKSKSVRAIVRQYKELWKTQEVSERLSELISKHVPKEFKDTFTEAFLKAPEVIRRIVARFEMPKIEYIPSGRSGV